MEPKKLAVNSDLKLVVKGIADAMILLQDVASGFSLADLSALIQVVQDSQGILANSAVLIPEWENLDDAARADLISYIQANANVSFSSNAQVDLLVQKVLSVAVQLSSIYALIEG